MLEQSLLFRASQSTQQAKYKVCPSLSRVSRTIASQRVSGVHQAMVAHHASALFAYCMGGRSKATSTSQTAHQTLGAARRWM